MWPFNSSLVFGSAGPDVASTLSDTVTIPHPYYPVGVEVAGYLANEWGVLTLISLFAACCAGVFSLAYLAVIKVRPSLPTSELFTLLWFVLSGCIHAFFEGYYVYNFRAMGGLQTLFGQLWKEYSLSDSRYLTSDPFVLCMETITAVFWGPLSFVVAYMIATEHPLRHAFQIIVSLGQLYGDVLYYATSMFDHYMFDISYCRPEGYYFWGYYFLMNAFWIVIPIVLLVSSVKQCAKAFRALQKTEMAAKTSSKSKKRS
ncbi:EBDP4, emopamil-binding protein [Lasiosphaeria ovina]|uniref:EBDP4, emopamil-binding protein n=1 Tax=Lasiosphaeria ovina TaxID=92902 RepID=A0AAE0TYA7_9PEZI|nr:EBDP4, emopamil-binding protein [Lasiosphaeria ovina]